ncbi:hypothetical protein ACWD4B_12260 [Streptomyces sp. NPDC002536]
MTGTRIPGSAEAGGIPAEQVNALVEQLMDFRGRGWSSADR